MLCRSVARDAVRAAQPARTITTRRTPDGAWHHRSDQTQFLMMPLVYKIRVTNQSESHRWGRSGPWEGGQAGVSAEQECLEGVGEAGRTVLDLFARNQRGCGVQDLPGKTPLKYIGIAIALAGAIVWNRAPNDLVLLVGILVTLGGVSVFGVQFD